MMLVDVTLVNTYHKPYADSTLNNMKKSELIEYVRMLENNYNIAVSFNHQQAKNVEKLLEQEHGQWEEPTVDAVVLPCMLGNRIYQADGIRIYESTISEITLTKSRTIYVTENVAFDESAIGKSVFLTREEAEAALAKMG